MKNRKEELIYGILPGEGLGPPTTLATERFGQALFDFIGKTKLLVRRSPFWVGTKGNINTNLNRDIINAVALYHECDFIQKGPTQTPSNSIMDEKGDEIKSINRLLTTKADTSVCIRPIRHYETIVTPQKDPAAYGHLVVVGDLREDFYAGVGIKPGEDMKKFQNIMMEEFGFRKDQIAYVDGDKMSVTFKLATEKYSKRIGRAGIEFGFANKRKNVHVAAKFNIDKTADLMFLEWITEVAVKEYGAVKVTDELFPEYEITRDGHTIRFGSVLSDAGLMYLNNYPHEYDVLLTQNGLRDLMSDDLTAKAGTLGTAPGININPETGKIICEPVGGTGMGKNPLGPDDPNPIAAMDSFLMGLEYLGYYEEAELGRKAIDYTVNVEQKLTFDLARGLGRTREESEGTISFTDALIENISVVASSSFA